MITAKYLITDTNDFLEITILCPENDLLSEQGNTRCFWTIKTVNFEKSDYSYGIDKLQCVQIAYITLAIEILDWEKTSGKSSEYYFMPKFELEHCVKIRTELYNNKFSNAQKIAPNDIDAFFASEKSVL